MDPIFRPSVGVIVDRSDTYGRAILRGVVRYANLQRRWLLFKDLERVVDVKSRWPDLDGAIFGIAVPVFERGRRHAKYVVYCSCGGDPAISPVVALDDIAAGTQAADHLLDCQFKHFAFYGRKAGHRVAMNRVAGFRQELGRRGFSRDVCPLPTPTPQERVDHSHRPALMAWLRELPRPVGLMAIDDTAAHDIADACLEPKSFTPRSAKPSERPPPPFAATRGSRDRADGPRSVTANPGGF